MQLGFVSALLHDHALDEVFRIAAGEGFDCVEVMCWPPDGPDRRHGGVCHLDVSQFTPALADDTRALCDKHGVAISALGYYSIPLSADADQAEACVAHLHRVIDAAPMLGLKNVNAFIGANKNLNLDENLKLFEQVWPPIIRHAEQAGVLIGIENCPMLFSHTWPFGLNLARTPAIWRQMFAAIQSDHFGLNYDPSHLRMQLIDPVGPIREFGPKIFHTHAKDMRVEQRDLDDHGSLVPPMERSTAKIPGYGDIDWGAWLGALTDTGFDGAVCIEVEDQAFEHGDLERRLASLRISRNVLRPLMG